MTVKVIGAILVIVGCAGYGFAMAAGCRREEKMLTQLLHILEFMESELEYRLTPLPQLCRDCSGQCESALKKVFWGLAQELENQISPDAACCMDAAVAGVRELPVSVHTLLSALGRSLGRFDLNGQMRELEAVRLQCAGMLEDFRGNRDQRIKSYQTLGICAGVALAILLI